MHHLIARSENPSQNMYKHHRYESFSHPSPFQFNSINAIHICKCFCLPERNNCAILIAIVSSIMLMLVGIIRKRGRGEEMSLSIEARYLKDGGFQVLRCVERQCLANVPTDRLKVSPTKADKDWYNSKNSPNHTRLIILILFFQTLNRLFNLLTRLKHNVVSLISTNA
jgi:hypothetical protein